MTSRRAVLVTLAAALVATACGVHDDGTASGSATGAPAGTGVFSAVATEAPRKVGPPSHVVVVVMENHSQSQIIGNLQAPFLNRLARKGANYTRSFAVTHPSQPNYLALFAGGRYGVTDNSCPHELAAANLGSQLRASGRSFLGFSEDLPAAGFTGCTSGAYARKHSPWVNFTDLPPSVNLPFTEFPTRFATLPTLSFVTPNLDHDMHDGSIAGGDAWLRENLRPYARWARHHDSLLVVTFDEDDLTPRNQIATIAYGARVRPGNHHTRIDHCRVLGTLERLYRLPRLGCAKDTKAIKTMWRR